MTPDGLPALSVSEMSQRPRAMAMVGMPRFPTACLSPPPGPQTCLCREGAVPFALPPCPLLSPLPPFPFSHF